MEISINNRIIENPVVQDKVTFLETFEETGGAYSLILVDLAPGGGNSDHYHDTIEEEFEAVNGDLTVVVNGETLTLKPGEKHKVNFYELHAFYNRTTERIQFKVKISPGSKDFEQFLQILYGLARDGKTDDKGVPTSLLDVATLGLLSQTYPPKNSFLHRIIPFLRWLGRQAEKRGRLEKLIRRYVRF